MVLGAIQGVPSAPRVVFAGELPSTDPLAFANGGLSALSGEAELDLTPAMGEAELAQIDGAYLIFNRPTLCPAIRWAPATSGNTTPNGPGARDWPLRSPPMEDFEIPGSSPFLIGTRQHATWALGQSHPA
jgi:hypothetical protein